MEHEKAESFLSKTLTLIKPLLYDGTEILCVGNIELKHVLEINKLIKETGMLYITMFDCAIEKTDSKNIKYLSVKDSKLFYKSYNIVIITEVISSIPECLIDVIRACGKLITQLFKNNLIEVNIIDKDEEGDVVCSVENWITTEDPNPCINTLIGEMEHTDDTMKGIIKEINKLLYCVMCNNIISSQIVLCQFGHIFCLYCSTLNKECPLCSNEWANIRFCKLDNVLLDIQKSDSYDSCSVKHEESLLNLVECPVCLDIMKPPTLTCVNGHIVGAECKSNLDICPTCRGNFSNLCFTNLDNILNNMPQKCIAYKQGCRVKFQYKGARQHFEDCSYFRKLRCTLAICMKQVPDALYCYHVRNVHKNVLGQMYGFPITVNPSLEIKDWSKFAFCRFIHEIRSDTIFNFFFGFTIDQLNVCVMYVGPECQVDNFSVNYKLVCGEKELLCHGKPVPYNADFIHQDFKYYERNVFSISKKKCIKSFKKGPLHISVSVFRNMCSQMSCLTLD